MQTRNKHYFIFNLLFLLILMCLSASCANKEETIERVLLEKELFDQAQNRLRSGNFAAAAMSLEMLEARYPFGRFATQAQSELFMLILNQQTMRLPYQPLIGLSACILIIQM